MGQDAGLNSSDDDRALGTGRTDGQPHAGLQQRWLPRDLNLLSRGRPIDVQARRRHYANHERTTNDKKRVRNQQRRLPAQEDLVLGRDHLHLSAVRTHHGAAELDEGSAHDYMMVRDEPLTVTCESLTWMLMPDFFKVMPC